MIEITVKNFLESKLSVPVLMEIPKSTPSSQLVIIEKTGGTQENHIPSSILTIQSYGASKYDAAVLNDMVKDWMLDGVEGLVTLDEVVSVNLNSDYDFTDTPSKKYRYQAVFDITHY